jgi:hypothetical protein
MAFAAALLTPGLSWAAIPAAPTPASTSAPVLAGIPAPGQTLSCSTGTWANKPSGFAYVWLRDGVPIAGQTGSAYVVQSADEGHSISCQVIATNVGGEYTIVGLASGSYTVSFSASEGGLDYLTQYYDEQPSPSAAKPVPVIAPGLTPNVDAVLQAGGQISGRVTASSGGAPLANIEACAFQREAGNCAITNAAGEYTIVALPSGTYSVTFFPLPNIPGGEGGGNYLPQTRAGVAVGAGTTTSGVDAELLAGGQIEGRVTDASAKPLAFIMVCPIEPPGELLFAACQFTNSAGEYTVSGLPSGSYDVQFIPGLESYFGVPAGNYLTQYYNGRASIAQAEQVSVTAPGKRTGIDAVLQPGGQISGTVTDVSTLLPLAHIEACVTGGGGFPFNCTTTGTAGEYTISSLSSGEYNVELRSREGGNYMPETLPKVKVEAPNTTTGTDAKMRAGGQIAGRVTDVSTGAPLANASVCVNAVCVPTNSAGEYRLSSLASGAYTVEFGSPVGGDYAPAALEGVAVTAGSTTRHVDAALQHGGQISGRVTAASSGIGVANIEVCAFEAGLGRFENCAITNGPGGSASARSNALAVPAPNSAFTTARGPLFDPRTGTLHFFFDVANAGTFRWSLSFRRCGGGHLKKHRRRCARLEMPFASGSQSVPAGAVEVTVHAGVRALKALRTRHTLHVRGPFTFQSALGGAPVTHVESAVVRPRGSRNHKKRRKHRRHG